MDARLAIDTGVLLLYFFGIVALGLWAGRRNKNLRDFSLGGRSIPWWAVLASIVAAETSAATFLRNAGRGFQNKGILLRPARHWNDPGARVYQLSPSSSRTTTIGCRASTSSSPCASEQKPRTWQAASSCLRACWESAFVCILAALSWW